ncbi:glutamate--cysteine ligase NDAI_0B05080 [Naumovozyma dairenensis CBS 421]|uniref:Glutamate--cysteine ligase n=1 Tax=Naumovozyma dairenensis (strain ATCC 10597 / BCRC 20456 / CBS 421 / NBRC 0211 / NRRL Y-12639) TaxID=1071378 RepID=G0W6Y0_NAUDC|nr:hypothetical protein NDAI_0B05080 [Naumovozyma dairenensis CBS 421]CCD23541.1 hypothetical protein NDAI_0B05080 [Naumovozyma dairenensis CBS 421]
MGLLAAGTPLQWLDSRKYNEFIKTQGIEQLLYVFQAASKRNNDPLLWGDELEYMMLDIDLESKNAMLDINHDSILHSFDNEDFPLCRINDVLFHPEYGRFMLEATPGKPYDGYMDEYIEFNMKNRRNLAKFKLDQFPTTKKKEKLVPISLTVFPRMGCEDFLNMENPWDHKNSVSRSLFLPDEVINRHARFPTLTGNIRIRRGEKVCINIPMFKDKFTPKFDDSIYERDWFTPEDQETLKASKPGFIYLDAMGFGMGSSCLQNTFQAPDIDKARYLYDSLCNFAPIFLAASAAAPAFKGWLADQDVRWNVISGAVDCRTPRERNVPPLLPKFNKDGLGGLDEVASKHVQKIPKSRYSCVDLYLGGNKFFNRTLNDTEVPINEKILKRLLENDKAPLDYDLAKHFAHLFIRDPISVFEESINQDNKTSTNHFENLQSTNWQSLRFKPPTQEAIPSNKNVPGWRVEFRPLEVQLTDFENAAYSTFIYLIVDCLLTFSDKINNYIPMSQIWDNMHTAHHRDAILNEKFYWKDSIDSLDFKSSKYSMNEIFHDSQMGIFATFINPILKHKGFIQSDWQELKSSKEHLRTYYYLKLISDRTSGKIPTIAKYIRNFIMNHPDYKHDSKVSKLINFDLIMACERITDFNNSRNEMAELFGKEITDYLLTNKLSYEK